MALSGVVIPCCLESLTFWSCWKVRGRKFSLWQTIAWRRENNMCQSLLNLESKATFIRNQYPKSDAVVPLSLSSPSQKLKKNSIIKKKNGPKIFIIELVKSTIVFRLIQSECCSEFHVKSCGRKTAKIGKNSKNADFRQNLEFSNFVPQTLAFLGRLIRPHGTRIEQN